MMGLRFAAISASLSLFVACSGKVGQGIQCSESGCLQKVAGVDFILLTPEETLRKAALDLAGRLPTDAELAAVASDAGALDGVLDTLMREANFAERLKEWFNDDLLTNKYLRYNDGLQLLNEELYPAVKGIKDNSSEAYTVEKNKISRDLAEEPLNLIVYTVFNDLPMSNILTAPYAVVTPNSVKAYGVSTSFKKIAEGIELGEAQIIQGGPDQAALPHAGLLTTSAFLHRWPTTATNLNRARARRVFQFFLGYDILNVAERPTDTSAELTQVDKPVRNAPVCSGCHNVLDPVAAAFQGWGEYPLDKYNPKDKWPQELLSAGFGALSMPPTESARVRWLAKQLVEDERFDQTMASVVFRHLTGRRLLREETPQTSDIWISARDAEDAFIQSVLSDYKKGNRNLKIIIKAIVKSAYYRAKDVQMTQAGSMAERPIPPGVGIGRLLSPEMLNRKIIAVLGAPWRAGYKGAEDYLGRDFRLLYGGIDSIDIVRRSDALNTLMLNTAELMAFEMACATTTQSFKRPASARILFKHVDMTTVPEAGLPGTTVSKEAVLQEIAYLFNRILGEKYPVDDPNILEAYTIFYEAWRELRDVKDTSLIYSCMALRDPLTFVDYPAAERITEDKYFTIKAWHAVLVYLLTDWKFIYD